MAIRVRAQLRKWFGRGMYPTAEQFSDLFDSFFHKTEDKIPMSGVEGLTDQLNGKYNTAEGRELEKKVQKVTDDLSVHVASSEKAFNEVQNDIEALDGRLDDEIERAKGEEAAIRRELAAGDAATLSSAKSYTDTSVAAEAEERTQGDAATLSSAKTYTDTAVADEAQKRGQGDAATLRAANEHTDAAVAEEASARESGDRATLQSAKDYVDKAIAELVDGSPAALDTLKELSAALGNDPNFATTVATQIGQKVDKVAGKGLSTEDYTSEEKAKLAGVAAGANNYQHPATHPATMIVEDPTHRFATDEEKAEWNLEYTLEKVATESGFASTYHLKKGTTKVGASINIPLDQVLKSSSIKTVTTANTPYSGAKVGDKYIEFLFQNNNTPQYLPVQDLVDVYTGDGQYIQVSASNVISLNYSVLALKLAADLKKSYDNFYDPKGAGEAAAKAAIDEFKASTFVIQCTIPGMN